LVAVPLRQCPQQRAKKSTKHAKAATVSVAVKPVKAVAMANDVTVAVVDATVAVANAAKARPAKSAHPAKVVVVVKAVAKDVLSEVNVLSALRAIVLLAKAAARVVARTAPKAAAMHSQS
jgi:hypothetical protein